MCFVGDLTAEEDVLQWLLLQKSEDRIELINRDMLEVMIEEAQYLAVFFCKHRYNHVGIIITYL